MFKNKKNFENNRAVLAFILSKFLEWIRGKKTYRENISGEQLSHIHKLRAFSSSINVLSCKMLVVLHRFNL